MKYLIFSIAFIVITACSSNESDFDATGTFESTEIIVSSEANGKIMELNLQEGDRLEAGAVLGYVDSTQLYLRKKQLEAVWTSENRISANRSLPSNSRLPSPGASNSVWRTW